MSLVTVKSHPLLVIAEGGYLVAREGTASGSSDYRLFLFNLPKNSKLSRFLSVSLVSIALVTCS